MCVCVFVGVPSGDQSDSIRDDVTRRLSSLSLDGSDDNVAVLSVLVSKGNARCVHISGLCSSTSTLALIFKQSQTQWLEEENEEMAKNVFSGQRAVGNSMRGHCKIA